MAYINLVAVLVASIVSMIVGSIWYGPLFGKMFMKAVGMDAWTTEEKERATKTMWQTYLVQFLASFVMFYVLAGLIVGFGHTTAFGGAMTAVAMWIGFVVPIKLGDAIWTRKMTMFWLGSGYQLILALVCGAILGMW